MKNSAEIYGFIIKSEREKRKLSLQAFANLLEIEKGYLWNIEKGRANMTCKYFDRLITKIGYSPKEFFMPVLNYYINKTNSINKN